jgi:hypothetical protein
LVSQQSFDGKIMSNEEIIHELKAALVARDKEILSLNNLLQKFVTKCEKEAVQREALRQAAFGELCGIELGDPIDFSGLEERE